jgi:dTDP-4-dehydrorhamnose 3,5-epimerase
MKVSAGPLHGVLVFEPQPVHDERGFFTRTFDAEVAASAGLDPATLVQDSQSRSSHGVLRGLHLRTDGGEGKLVRCSFGRVFDVAVDLRPWSPTFREWQGVLLDDEQHRAVWLPRGLAHGFQVISEQADICYRIDRTYAPGFDATIKWDDPQIGVEWPLAPTQISVKDQGAPSFAEVSGHLGAWFGTVAPELSLGATP